MLNAEIGDKCELEEQQRNAKEPHLGLSCRGLNNYTEHCVLSNQPPLKCVFVYIPEHTVTSIPSITTAALNSADLGKHKHSTYRKKQKQRFLPPVCSQLTSLFLMKSLLSIYDVAVFITPR